MPDQPPRPSLLPYVLCSVVAGVLIGAVVVIAGALAGWWSAPIHADRLQHAVFLVIAGYPCYGAIPGLAAGLLLGWWARRRRPK